MLRRSLFLGVVTAVAVVGLASSATARANVTVERYHVDTPQVEESPNCTNESISWTGGYDVVITTTTTDTGSTRSLNYVQKMEGVGLTTGDSYALTSRYHETSRESGTGADVYHFGSTYVQRSLGGKPDYLAQTSGTQVITPTGIVIGDLEDGGHGFIRCVG
jgi:hypothetical protein